MTRSAAYPSHSSTSYQPDTPSNMVYSADGLPIYSPESDGAIVESKNNQAHMETPMPLECAPPAVPSGSTIVYPSNSPVAVTNPRYVYLNTRKPVVLTYCPHCAQQNIATRTRTKVTGMTWVCVGAGVFIFWPLCWLPFVIKPMKQTNHYCSSCGVKVGRVKPFH